MQAFKRIPLHAFNRIPEQGKPVSCGSCVREKDLRNAPPVPIGMVITSRGGDL